MTNFFPDKTAAAQFVYDTIRYSRPGSPLTITMHPGKLEGFSVGIAITVSSDATETPTSSNVSRTISDKAPDYSLPPGRSQSDLENEYQRELAKRRERDPDFRPKTGLSMVKEKDAGLE